MQRQQADMKRVAVMEYIATEFSRLSGLLESLGVTATPSRPATQFPTHINGYQPPPQAPVVNNPCTWCGRGPTQLVNTGGGVTQYLCRVHRVYVQAQVIGEDGGSAKARAVGMSVDATEPTYNPVQQPKMGTGKMVMQPIEQDFQASQRPANGTGEQPQLGFEEMPEDGDDTGTA